MVAGHRRNTDARSPLAWAGDIGGTGHPAMSDCCCGYVVFDNPLPRERLAATGIYSGIVGCTQGGTTTAAASHRHRYPCAATDASADNNACIVRH